jgi:hypothetical protein
MSPQKQAVMDSMVGRPFVLLPGKPAGHVVMGESWGGQKLRAAEVQQVWNDMLLMDAIQGKGFYLRHARPTEAACIEVAERFYGMSASDAVTHWLALGRTYKAVEWPGEVKG